MTTYVVLPTRPHTFHGLDLGKRFILGCDVLIPEIDGIQMMRKIKAVEPTLVHSTNTLYLITKCSYRKAIQRKRP